VRGGEGEREFWILDYGLWILDPSSPSFAGTSFGLEKIFNRELTRIFANEAAASVLWCLRAIDWRVHSQGTKHQESTHPEDATRHVPQEQIVTNLGIQLVWRHFFAIWEISSFACLSNLISDSLRRRGVEQVTRFRACKAVIAESEVFDPPGFEFWSVFFTEMNGLLLIV